MNDQDREKLNLTQTQFKSARNKKGGPRFNFLNHGTTTIICNSARKESVGISTRINNHRGVRIKRDTKSITHDEDYFAQQKLPATIEIEFSHDSEDDESNGTRYPEGRYNATKKSAHFSNVPLSPKCSMNQIQTIDEDGNEVMTTENGPAPTNNKKQIFVLSHPKHL